MRFALISLTGTGFNGGSLIVLVLVLVGGLDVLDDIDVEEDEPPLCFCLFFWVLLLFLLLLFLWAAFRLPLLGPLYCSGIVAEFKKNG